jgi:putative transposase
VILGLIDEAARSGARLQVAAETVGLSARTIIRWRQAGGGVDRRQGPHSTPSHALSKQERQRVLSIANSKTFRDLSPKQIVPKLADQGLYVASESSFYRVLKENWMLTHREPSKPATKQRPKEQVATGPCQVWSWDITYLRSPVRGMFFYLYLIMDVWSRKIVAAQVLEEESMDHSAPLFAWACTAEGVEPEALVLHSDNGGPMKGATMLATLQKLGVAASFSRPSVSNDNPYSEALFRTLKYRPEYPSKPFASVHEAQAWVDEFVAWYNTEHLHSAIKFVTPEDRHQGREDLILAHRTWVYQQARKRSPSRWSGQTRNWQPVRVVRLNPDDKLEPCHELSLAA